MGLEQIGLEAVLQDENFQAGLQRYMSGLGKAGGATEKAASGMTAFGHTMSTAVGSAIGYLTGQAIPALISGLGGLVKGALAGNAEFERYNAQFTTLLGSADAAKERLDKLAEFGAKTPFELPQVVQADKILQGFGLHSKEAAQKFGFSGEDILTIAGDVASGTGADFQEMSLMLGKFSAGATGEAMARMAEMGIASKDDLAKMGLEFSKSGELLSPLPKAMNVVLTLMKTKYGGLMDAQSKTFEGMMSNLSDWWGQTKRKIAEPIFNVVKDNLGKLLEFLGSPQVQSAITNLANGLSVVAGNVATVLSGLVSAGQGLMGIFSSDLAAAGDASLALTDGLYSIAKAFGATDTQAEIFSQDTAQFIDQAGRTIIKVFSDVRSIMQNIASIVMPYFKQASEDIGRAIPIVSAAFQTAWKVIQDIVLSVRDIFVADVIPSFQEAFNSMTEALAELGLDWGDVWDALKVGIQTAGKIIGAVVLLLIGLFAGLAKGISSAVKTGASYVKGFAKDLKTLIEDIAKVVANWIEFWKAVFRGDFSEALKFAGAGLKAFVDTMGTLFDMAIDIVKGSIDIMLNLVSGFVTGVINFFQNLYKRLVGSSIIPDMMRDIQNVITNALNAILNFVGGILNTLAEVFRSGFEMIKGIVQAAWQAIQNGVTTAWQAITQTIYDAIAAIPGAVQDAIASVIEIGTNIVNTIEEGISSTWNLVTDWISGALSGLAAAVWNSDIFQSVMTVGNNIIYAIRSGISTLWSAAEGVIGKMQELLGGFWESVKDSMSGVIATGAGIVEAIKQGIVNNWNNFVDWLKGLIGGIFGGGSGSTSLNGLGSNGVVAGSFGQQAMATQYSSSVMNTQNFYLTVNSMSPVSTVVQDFHTMQSLAAV